MSVALVYAKALYSVIGADDKTTTQQLRETAKIFQENPALSKALYSPLFSVIEKTKVIKALTDKTNTTPIVSRFLTLLASKNRLSVLSEIVNALDDVRLDAKGGVLGVVYSPDVLDPADLADLAKAFSKKLNRPVEFRSQEQANLIAGIKVTVGGVTYDGSIRGQLSRLKDQFLNKEKMGA